MKLSKSMFLRSLGMAIALERFAPSDYVTGYWKVFRHNIESNGSGVFSSLEKVSKKIGIAKAKIFLVTGMAGQGKTNFDSPEKGKVLQKVA
ncbi:MAG: hypothetical protein IPH82_29075 [Chloroflexi bacterium]|nr:hypothetical protein [Chloroflexota bacterium]